MFRGESQGSAKVTVGYAARILTFNLPVRPGAGPRSIEVADGGPQAFPRPAARAACLYLAP